MQHDLHYVVSSIKGKEGPFVVEEKEKAIALVHLIAHQEVEQKEFDKKPFTVSAFCCEGSKYSLIKPYAKAVYEHGYLKINIEATV